MTKFKPQVTLLMSLFSFCASASVNCDSYSPATVQQVDVIASVCVEASRFEQVTVGDVDRWAIKQVIKEFNGSLQSVYQIAPLSHGISTTLLLHDSEGRTHTWVLNAPK